MADEQDDRPWTEQQWDQFLRQADLRTARYGELMETLMDDPDREEIIDHEMGWDRKREAADEQWLQEISEAAAEAEEELATFHESAVDDPRDVQQMNDVHQLRDRELHAIPAYAACETASNAIDQALVPLMRDKDDELADEDIAQAYIQIKIAAAKIATGHGMGYEDEVLGGNVVNCKRALAAVDECEIALKLVADKNLVPAAAILVLLQDVAKAHKTISERIDELRKRMWWQAG